MAALGSDAASLAAAGTTAPLSARPPSLDESLCALLPLHPMLPRRRVCSFVGVARLALEGLIQRNLPLKSSTRCQPGATLTVLTRAVQPLYSGLDTSPSMTTSSPSLNLIIVVACCSSAGFSVSVCGR